jgi:phosphosulfolactate phosphohydrolase-like enzyme
VWKNAPALGRNLPRFGPAEQVPYFGWTSDAGPRAYEHSNSPKHSVASVIGFLKGMSADAGIRRCGMERKFTGEDFSASGYVVSTVQFELEQVRQYIRKQEAANGSSGQVTNARLRARATETFDHL